MAPKVTHTHVAVMTKPQRSHLDLDTVLTDESKLITQVPAGPCPPQP